MSESLEERIKRIEENLDRLNKRLESLDKITSYVEELERSGTLPLLLKSIDVITHSFDALADTKNLRLLSILLTVVEGISKIDPSLVTLFSDSLGNCMARTQTPEVMKQLKEAPEIGGLRGMLKILSDPDVKKLIGIIYIYAKLIGGCLPEEMKPKLEHLEKLYEARLKMLEERKI